MTTNWMEQNRELFRALKLEQIVTFIVIALIVIVAALNILIALTMMVMEKTRDIAVMMSFGVEPGQVRRIFLLQGLLISVVGTALGLVLGYVASWAGGHYHFIHLSADVYSIDTLPFAPRLLDGVIVAAVSIGISLLATLYPSSSAAASAAGRGAAVRVNDLLRRDNPAQRMPPRQHNAAMIHFSRALAAQTFGQDSALDQRAAAGRAPVRLRLFGKHRVALAANPFHIYEITGLGPLSDVFAGDSSSRSARYTQCMHPPPSPGRDRHGWHSAADDFADHQRAQRAGAAGGAGGRHHGGHRHRPPPGLHRAVAGRVLACERIRP